METITTKQKLGCENLFKATTGVVSVAEEHTRNIFAAIVLFSHP